MGVWETPGSSSLPQVFVCLGAGGVGKTSCSAALALAFAQQGRRTLAVTLDPARRLQDALGKVVIEQELPLTIYQPRADTEFATLVDDLFHDQPTHRQRLGTNRVFAALSSALAGMHEMAAIARLPAMVASTNAEVVIVDTAPTRHALKSMRLAGRVLELVDSRVLTIIARLLGASTKGATGRVRQAIGRLARRPIANVLEATVGERPVLEMAELMELLLTVRPQLARMAADADALFGGADTRYLVVTSTSDAAVETASYLATEVGAMGRSPTAFLVNRAAESPAPWIDRLANGLDVPGSVRTAAARVKNDAGRASQQAARAEKYLQTSHSTVARLKLPSLDAADPQAVVASLSALLATHFVAESGAA